MGASGHIEGAGGITAAVGDHGVTDPMVPEGAAGAAAAEEAAGWEGWLFNIVPKSVAEAGLPDYVYDAWFGVMAPAQTPPAVLAKASADINRVLAMPEVQQKLEAQGIDPVAKSQQEFDRIIKSDAERYGKMWKAANPKTE